MAEIKKVTACLLIVGDEVLSGRTKDANLAFLGMELNEIGIRMSECRVVPDEEDVIVAAINEVRARYDYIFTTGGIGPTHDDITAACVAKAFGVELHRHPEAVEIFLEHYAPKDMNETRWKMAETPIGADLIHNPVSRPPGFKMENVYVMAGIPRVMQGMFGTFKDTLEGGDKLLSRTIPTHAKEGDMGKPLKELQKNHPDVEIGSYPFFQANGGTGVRIALRHPDMARIDEVAEDVIALIHDLGEEVVDEG
ncbi:MAG: competence/damage-inducible protein A [Rhodospirillales bacterium]|jgi:molybdenum cofactor synthesis domain-containing protein|nr:competence/damage-inducible protein A [Rhodospirillales bacterium]MBT3906343.1 competence/damage-inducible protein A [Rhodospirillaceae bacterium]MBT5036397.1 competence/damage-inducible protein A [Rhodospirillaceae bacterium]MBT6221536.1 competence/damage-inducible protein A [Rhodospirillaceae bacterium]MBT6363071.1 competence/damage-inducible protein A [Rhodospirillaceae bacterium]